MNTSEVLLVAAGAGFAGWALENVFFGPRFSSIMPDGFPFLPVYAVGGAAIALVEPHIEDQPSAIRFSVYAGMLSGVELAAGALERSQGRMSWDYGGTPVDLPHALAWGALGLLAEGAIKSVR